MERKMKKWDTPITAGKIFRILAILCIIFVFCPSFMVSCSGRNIDVNVITAVNGISMYGEKVVKPHPIMILCLVIPVAVLVLLHRKAKNTNVMILFFMVADAVLWMIFRIAVKKIALENYCTFKTTFWYGLNMVVILLMIFLSAMTILQKTGIDHTQNSTTDPPKPLYCPNCGTKSEPNASFCGSCGSKIK